MDPGRTYNIRLRNGVAEAIPSLTLRCGDIDKGTWILTEVKAGTEQYLDVAEAWLILSQGRQDPQYSVTETLCSWCHPIKPEENGISHGVCDSCKEALVSQLVTAL
jgi:hypothetical protein